MEGNEGRRARVKEGGKDGIKDGRKRRGWKEEKEKKSRAKDRR